MKLLQPLLLSSILYLSVPSIFKLFPLIYCYIKKLGKKILVLKAIKKCFYNLGASLVLVIVFSLITFNSNVIEASIISILLGNNDLVDPYNYGPLIETNKEWTEKEKIINNGIFFGNIDIISVEELNKDTPKLFYDSVEEYTNVNGTSPDKELIEFGDSNDYKYLDDRVLRSVDEISAEINKYSHPIDVDIQLYIEEFYSRAKAYSYYPSNENAYQTARAADDVVSVLTKGNAASCKIDELLYFSDQCLSYYVESLKYQPPPYVTRNDIYLKMAIIVQKLIYRSELEEKRNTLLLYSNALLQLIESYEPDDILCRIQYDYYYGVSLYNVGVICNIDDIDYYKKALIYLMRYLSQENQKEEYTNSCNDTILKIYKKYPTLKGTVLESDYPALETVPFRKIKRRSIFLSDNLLPIYHL